MTIDFSLEWTKFHRGGAPELYPEDRRDEIDEVAELVYRDVNNGVYRTRVREQPERLRPRVRDGCSTRLDWLEDRLRTQRYLVGDTITEADVRLFTTLARFDAVYHGHFKCNRTKLTELPVLWAYARDLFPDPGVRRHDRLQPDQAPLLRGARRASIRAASSRSVPISPVG